MLAPRAATDTYSVRAVQPRRAGKSKAGGRLAAGTDLRSADMGLALLVLPLSLLVPVPHVVQHVSVAHGVSHQQLAVQSDAALVFPTSSNLAAGFQAIEVRSGPGTNEADTWKERIG